MKKLIKLSLLLFTIHLALADISAQTEQKAELVVQTGHSLDVQSVVYSPDGKFLASSSLVDNTILWDTTTGQELREIVGANPIFSPDGNTLATFASSGIKLWNWQTGQEIRNINSYTTPFGITFSPNGEILAIADYSTPTIITVWNVKTGQELRSLAGHTDAIDSIIFSPDNRHYRK